MDNKNKLSAINFFFIIFLGGAILFAAFSGRMKEVSDASFEAAKSAVTLAIGLIGIMGLWLGLMRVLEAGGFMHTIAHWVKPLMVRLFPDVPGDHPAMSAMVLNISANMLGLGNAATPFGIKAMVELNRLNPLPGTATNAMCLFLAINTSSVSILPLGVIGVRASAGSADPAGIFLPTLIATSLSTFVGVATAILLAKFDSSYQSECANAAAASKTAQQGADSESSNNKSDDSPDYAKLLIPPALGYRFLGYGLITVFFLGLFYTIRRANEPWKFLSGDMLSYWLMPFLMLLILSYGLCRGVKLYEAVTEGAKQGFETAVRIIPYLVVILVAIGMFRASGAMDFLVSWLSPLTLLIGMPADTLPMALMRPLSGGGAFALMSDLIKQSPDSFSAYVASVMMGSTETTFYVLAIYFGAVGIGRIRHALAVGIMADIAGLCSSPILARLFWHP